MRSFWIARVLNPMTGLLIRRNMETQTQREEDRVAADAGNGAVQLQAQK